jgi:CO dehydrogenase/acetyl-CoA synthase alpha subunit
MRVGECCGLCEEDVKCEEAMESVPEVGDMVKLQNKYSSFIF